MRNLKAKIAILLTIILMLPLSNFAAKQSKKKTKLKVSGKIFDREKSKADITIFIEKNGDWIKVVTIKSKTRYTLNLIPENNYYVLFENVDGKKKTLYLDAGEPGAYNTKLDIDFTDELDTYAKCYQHPIRKEYVFQVIDKRIAYNAVYSLDFKSETANNNN